MAERPAPARPTAMLHAETAPTMFHAETAPDCALGEKPTRATMGASSSAPAAT